MDSQLRLMRDLLARTSSGIAGGNNLTIAEALWTRGVQLKPRFAEKLQRRFQVQLPYASRGNWSMPASPGRQVLRVLHAILWVLLVSLAAERRE
jgi:hypothetical protein